MKRIDGYRSALALPLAGVLVCLAPSSPAAAQSSILLDDFTADDMGELFADLGLLAVTGGELPFLILDESWQTPGEDVGAIRYTDADPESGAFAFGQYPSSVLESLLLDFEALNIVGFRATFANNVTLEGEPWSFGIRMLDDGENAFERKSAGGDVLVPAGPGTVVVETYFDGGDWVFDDGFELDDIRQVTFALNAPNDVDGGASNIPTLTTEFLRFEAIVGPPTCDGDVDGSGAVDFFDLLAVLSVFGPCDDCPEDLSGNGVVDFVDVLDLLASWGPCG